MQPDTIADRLHALADVVAHLNVARDWVDDPDEILTVVEAAAALADVSGETIRRWCSENRIGRLFAGSLWLVSRRRLLKHIEARSGKVRRVIVAHPKRKTERGVFNAMFPISNPVDLDGELLPPDPRLPDGFEPLPGLAPERKIPVRVERL